MIFNITDFDQAAVDKRVYRRDFGELSLYTYTEEAAHNRDWCPITRAARGIIFDRATGEVVALPFPKFFNLGELPETTPEMLPSGNFVTEEKLDGSLGIIFHHAGRWNISTKGSLNSEQANYAREELLPRYNLSNVHTHFTILVEILYPENRIVVDYRGARELVLLSAINRRYGREITPFYARKLLAKHTGMREVPTHEYDNFMQLPFQENQEGYVIRWNCNTRVKIKSPRYVQVHKLLTYKSPRRILEAMQKGDYAEIRAQLPHEIAGDFDDISASLYMSVRQYMDQAYASFANLKHLAEDRKQFALAVQQQDPNLRPMLFQLLDGKDPIAHAYRLVERGLKEESNGDS